VKPANYLFVMDRDYLAQSFIVAGLDMKATLDAAGVEARVYKRRVGPSLLKKYKCGS
jgi:hypothetical protein